MLQLFWQIVWVLGDIIEFASRIGIMFCITMFVITFGLSFVKNSGEVRKELPASKSENALGEGKRKPLPRNRKHKSLPR